MSLELDTFQAHYLKGMIKYGVVCLNSISSPLILGSYCYSEFSHLLVPVNGPQPSNAHPVIALPHLDNCEPALALFEGTGLPCTPLIDVFLSPSFDSLVKLWQIECSGFIVWKECSLESVRLFGRRAVEFKSVRGEDVRDRVVEMTLNIGKGIGLLKK